MSDEQTDRGNAGGAGGGDCLDSLCRDAADRQHRCPHAPYDRAQTIDAEQSMPGRLRRRLEHRACDQIVRALRRRRLLDRMHGAADQESARRKTPRSLGRDRIAA